MKLLKRCGMKSKVLLKEWLRKYLENWKDKEYQLRPKEIWWWIEDVQATFKLMREL